MTAHEPFVSQVDIAALSWPQFRTVLDVYQSWITDVWMHAESHTYGVRLMNVPLLTAAGLHETVANAEQPALIVGIPTDGRKED